MSAGFDPRSPAAGSALESMLELERRLADADRRIVRLEAQMRGVAPAQPFTLSRDALGQGVPRVQAVQLIPNVQMIMVRWSAVPLDDLKVYQIDVADDSAFQTNVERFETTQTMFTIPNRLPTQTYFVRVRAVAQNPRGGVREGGFSDALSTSSGLITAADMPSVIIPSLKLNDQTLTNVAQVDIPLAGWDPANGDLEVRLRSLTGVSSSGSHLEVVFSFDNGLTFIASGYEYSYFTSLAATFPFTIGTAQAQARLTSGGSGIANNRNLDLYIRGGGVKTFGGSHVGQFAFTMAYAPNAGGTTRASTFGHFFATVSGGGLLTTMTHMRIRVSAGTFNSLRSQAYAIQ